MRRRVVPGEATQPIVPQDYEVDNKKMQAKKVTSKSSELAQKHKF